MCIMIWLYRASAAVRCEMRSSVSYATRRGTMVTPSPTRKHGFCWPIYWGHFHHPRDFTSTFWSKLERLQIVSVHCRTIMHVCNYLYLVLVVRQKRKKKERDCLLVLIWKKICSFCVQKYTDPNFENSWKKFFIFPFAI